MAFDMFRGLPFRHFPVIVADPPWTFSSNSKARPGRNPMRHYNCMSLADIARLPVGQYAAPNSICGLWMIGPLLALGAHIPVLRSWGFEPTSMGYTWIKLNPSASPHFFTMADIFKGGGFTTRKNAEFVVFGKRGRSVRVDADVHEVIIAPRREHSRKPEEFYRRMERYAGDVPRLELFGRQQRPGWVTVGNQASKFRELYT